MVVSMLKYGFSEVEDRPTYQHEVATKWVFRKDSSLSKEFKDHKARLVVKGLPEEVAQVFEDHAGRSCRPQCVSSQSNLAPKASMSSCESESSAGSGDKLHSPNAAGNSGDRSRAQTNPGSSGSGPAINIVHNQVLNCLQQTDPSKIQLLSG